MQMICLARIFGFHFISGSIRQPEDDQFGLVLFHQRGALRLDRGMWLLREIQWIPADCLTGSRVLRHMQCIPGLVILVVFSVPATCKLEVDGLATTVSQSQATLAQACSLCLPACFTARGLSVNDDSYEIVN